MAQIDKFIDVLFRSGADRLEVTSGSRLALNTDGERRAISAQPVSLEQVEHLLAELLADLGHSPYAPDGHEFEYDAVPGPVRVAVQRGGGRVRLRIVPLAPTGPSGPGDASNAGPDSSSLAGAAYSPLADAGVATAAADPVGPRVSGPRSPSDESSIPPARARIEALFRQMVEEGCSDLHLSTGAPPLFRKDGEIVSLSDEPPVSADEAREVLLSIAPPHKREEFEKKHDTDFAHEIAGLARFRCNLFMDRKGTGGVFRVIPTKIRTVEDLGLPKEMVDLCHLPKGLVLVTGPTGSGKSTTLAALVDYINRNRKDHVVTIEDPIEFVHENKQCLINQREVGTHTKGFKVALRAALREDPDVVLVGEMRDLETVAIAIETAETGHLVFGTLHTNTAASTIDRVIDQFPADQQGQIRVMLAESLRGVISQTLVKAQGGGRVAAMEFLLVTTAVSNLIREGKTYQIPSVMQTSKGKGMQTLNDALTQLVKSGRVAAEVAYLAAVDKAELKGTFTRAGIVLPPTALGS